MVNRLKISPPGIAAKWLFVVFLACGYPWQAYAQNGINQEYIVKAGYLYNFTQFIDWPGNQGRKFSLCVAGKNPFGEILDKLAEKRRFKGKELQIHLDVPYDKMRNCNILLVNQAEQNRMEIIVDKIGTRSVLVIGDGEDFAKKGAGIGLVIRDNRIRFEINRKSLQRAGLKVSSELLNLGILVEEDR